MSKLELPIFSRAELIDGSTEHPPSNWGPSTLAQVTIAIPVSLFLDVVAPSAPSVSSNWFEEELQKLRELGALEENWNTYGASAPNDLAIESAAKALEYLNSLEVQPDRVAASSEGGVAVSFFENEEYADIEFFNTGEIAAITSNASGREVWEVSDSEVESSLDTIVKYVDRRHEIADANQSSSTAPYVLCYGGTLLSIQESESSTQWQASTGFNSLSKYLSQ